jgi:hypothetical protein
VNAEGDKRYQGGMMSKRTYNGGSTVIGRGSALLGRKAPTDEERQRTRAEDERRHKDSVLNANPGVQKELAIAKRARLSLDYPSALQAPVVIQRSRREILAAEDLASASDPTVIGEEASDLGGTDYGFAARVSEEARAFLKRRR